ncbi:MAG TPA: RNA ligase family protein, partial [Nitrososphaeraceae archaeon]
METSWHSYPSIYALGHREVRGIFQSEVQIEEKIDGSQFSFGVFNGELKLKSKSKELVECAPEKLFNKAAEYVISIKHLLTDGYTYRGEYLQKPSHNTLCYSRVPTNNIMIFDINDGYESYLSYDDKKIEAERIGLEVIPLMFRGIIEDPTILPSMIERVSVLGGQDMEGLVVKNYSMFGSDKKVLMCKYVSEKFKEIHRKSWKENNPNKKDVLQLLIEALKTEARWRKAVHHLKDKGELEESPRDIPKVMKEIDEDIKKECLEYISEKLMDWAMPNILRGIKSGVPEWYKKFLIDNAYGNQHKQGKG